MKRHLITTALIALTVTMALAVESPQQPPSVITDPEFRGILENLHPQEVKSLAGIKEMSVVIDRLNADLVASGLRGEEIRNDAEALLRGVQISAVSQQQLKKVDGYPFLKVKVDVDPETIKNKPYTGLVKVALTQYVALNRQLTQADKINKSDPKDTKYRVTVDARDLIFAETWHTQRTFKTNDMKGIREAAADVVKSFVHDYQEAKK